MTPMHHIDWQAPWLCDLRAIGASAHQRVLTGASVAQALSAQPGTPMRFVPQADLPAGTAYESFIFDTASVPTRDNLHDFFNGLIWQHYPQTKRRLNQLQAQAIVAQGGVGPVRGPLRDALPDDGPRTGPAHSLRAALREAFQHRGFWLLSLGFFACGFQLAFIALHLPAYLLGKGLSGNAAVVGLALIALSNVLGTYCCGWLGGMFRRTYLLAAIYVLRAGIMALFFMLPLSHTSLYLFCLAMGFVWLGTVPLTNGVIAQIFGVKYLTTLFGFVFFGHQLGAFFGVWLGGYLYDTTHSYDLVWLVGIGLGGVAALLHWPINDQPVSRPAALSLRPCA